MRYLKPFNESKQLRSELKDFCEMSLAYLVDDGMKIEINDSGSTTAVVLSFNKVPNYWMNIKDHVVPFLLLLKKRYKVYNNIVSVSYKKTDIDDNLPEYRYKGELVSNHYVDNIINQSTTRPLPPQFYYDNANINEIRLYIC